MPFAPLYHSATIDHGTVYQFYGMIDAFVSRSPDALEMEASRSIIVTLDRARFFHPFLSLSFHYPRYEKFA